MNSSRNTRTKSSTSSSTATKRKQRNDVETAAAGVRYLGVWLRPSGRYGAQISDPLTKEPRWLGTFDTAEEAALAYDRSTRSMRGLKARTNFVYSDMPPGSSVTSIVSPDDNQIQQINAPTPTDVILNYNFYSSIYGGEEEWTKMVQKMMPCDNDYNNLDLPPLSP